MITMRRVLSCLYHLNPQFRCLLIPKPSFLFQRKEVAGSSSTCPKKEDKETAPPSLLAFLHVSSLQCKLKVGRWPIFQCQDMHLCQDMHPCLICSCTSASTQAPRSAFAPGEGRYWCTLNSCTHVGALAPFHLRLLLVHPKVLLCYYYFSPYAFLLM